jgi:hypothetical protein
MKVLWAALLVASAAAAEHNSLTAKEKAEGWKLLFDGRTFAGWEDPARKSPPGDSFTIDDGCLKATRKPRFNEDLFSRDRFENFELLFDWRISEGGNSGVKYRIQDHVWVEEPPGKKFEDQVALAFANRVTKRPDKGHDYVVGFEYQCIDNERHPDGRRGGSHASGALYDMVAPSAQAAKPAGEFNVARLIVNGSHIEHWLNGVKVVDADLSSEVVAQSAANRWGKDSKVYGLLVRQPARRTRISLQNHNDEAWFRNIKIRTAK